MKSLKITNVMKIDSVEYFKWPMRNIVLKNIHFQTITFSLMVNMLFIVISKICPLRITFLTLISTENYILLSHEFTILVLSYIYLIFPYSHYDSTNQIKLKDVHMTIKGIKILNVVLLSSPLLSKIYDDSVFGYQW